MSDIYEAIIKDIEEEHAALIQYLYHAYATPDEELRGKLESIARDEMKHFKWLTEWLVKKGHKPTFDRGQVVIEGDLVSLLEADAAAEDETIKRYLYHKTLTDDEELLSLLDRIIADERSHYKEFLDMIEELSTEAAEAETDSTEEEDTSDEESPPGLTPAQAALLQESLEDEYTSVLQYLYRYFTSRDGDEFEDYAIDEMKHMGWFAEALADSNIQPKLTHVAREIDNHEQALKIELSREEETIEKYSGARAKFADEEIKDLFELALSHEKYHADGLKREIVKQEKRSGKRFTIGLPGRSTVGLTSDWSEEGSAYEDVVKAIEVLAAKGFHDPYALVVSPQLYGKLIRAYKNTNYLELDLIKKVVTDGVYKTPAIKGNRGVLLATGAEYMDLAVALDLTVIFVETAMMHHYFRVMEMVVPRIMVPAAVCTLEPA